MLGDVTTSCSAGVFRVQNLCFFGEFLFESSKVPARSIQTWTRLKTSKVPSSQPILARVYGNDHDRQLHQDVVNNSAPFLKPNGSEDFVHHDSIPRWRVSEKTFGKRAYKPASDKKWTKAIQDGSLLKILRSEDVTTPLQALALSTESKEWDFVQTQHTKTWEVDGVKGPVRCRCLWLVVKWDSNFAIGPLMENTQIQYQNFWFGRDQDASKCTLVLIGMFSPAGMVNELEPPPDRYPNLPQLATWSDMMSQKFPCPKQIIITSVVTESTRRILDRVRENLREEPEGVAWPGDRFHPDSDAGRAILGTIHGRSLAWFLIQNRHQFGNKSFWSIYLFRREECNKTGGYQPWDYKLYFEIGYVQEQDATGGAEIC
ncbi:DNA replication licensing factor [Venturia nashicola]|uniref:DNA replication licensing factor n=1 Tax=Venturia nashicola TaxID=86259 RepID=A0A4Z1PCC4_9PEZI|nr:DNA replication licensing factor [Venturia nashicola]